MNVMDKMYRFHFEEVSNYVSSHIKNAHVAQELIQEVFIRALENEEMMKGLNEAEQEEWLLATAEDLCLVRQKRIEKQKSNIGLIEDIHTTDESMDDVVTKFINQAGLQEVIFKTMPLLKKEHQQAIECFDIKQMNYKECASEMNISEVAFSSLLKRARKALIIAMIKVHHPQINRVDMSERELKQLLYWFNIVDFPKDITEEISIKTRNFFNALNKNYEIFRGDAYPEGLDEYLMSVVELKEQMKIADFGSGSGNLTIQLSPFVSEVYAIDHSSEMTESLTKEVRRRQLTNVHPEKIDLCSDLTFLHEKIDVAYCCMTLHHVFDPRAVLQELTKTLKEGGHLIIADLKYTTANWRFKEVHDLWSGFKVNQLQKWIEDAGLEIIEIEEKEQFIFRFEDLHDKDKRIEVPLIFAHCIKK